jgi:surface antigen
MKKLVAIFSMVLACASFQACATKQGTGAVVGAGTGAAAGAAIAKNNALGAVVGGLVGGLIGGAIGRQMDKNDQSQLARTFEYNATGSSNEWRNPDTGYTYSATPTSTFERENQPCRRFTLDADVEGSSTGDERVTGTACRRSDGTWEIVNQR